MELLDANFNEEDLLLEPLFIAAEYGRNDYLQELLNKSRSLANGQGLDVNIVNSNDVSPLMIASYKGFGNVVATLLQYGAKAQLVDKSGITALHLASANNCMQVKNDDIIGLLIQYGSIIGAKDSMGNQPIHYAAACGASETIKDLLNAGACINAPNAFSQTPLHLAMQFHREAVITQLIKHEDVQLLNEDLNGKTALFYAFESEQYVVLAMMLAKLKNNPDPTESFDPGDFLKFVGELASDKVGLALELLQVVGWDSKSEDPDAGGTLLHAACYNNDVKTIAALLEKNIDIDRPARSNNIENHWEVGDSPIHAACRHASSAATALLVDRGCKVDVPNETNNYPLHLAVQSGSADTVEALLDAEKINLDIKNGDKTSPLHIAAYNGFMDIGKRLLIRGANVHVQNSDGWTPLHHAAENSRVSFIQLLLNHDANIDARAQNTNTPLHTAVISGQVDSVEALLQLGAHVNARGEKNFTPLHKCAQMGDEKVTRILLTNGARTDHRAENNNMPLHTAASHGKFEVVKVLVEQCTFTQELNKSGFNGWNAIEKDD